MPTFPKPLVPVLNVGSFLVEDLVMALPMAEGAGGALADISGNGHDAVIAGVENTDYQWVTDPDMGVVLELLTASSWLDLAASLLTAYAAQGSATLQCWIKLTNASPAAGQRGFANITSLAGANTRTLYPDTSIDARFQSNVFRGLTRVEDVPLDGGVARDDWHLITITTQSGGQYSIYQNDILIGGGLAEAIIGMSGPLQFGRSDDTTPASDSMQALVGDLRLFKRAIQAYEVGNVFNNPWGLYTFIQPPGQADLFGVSMDFARGGVASSNLVELLADVPRGSGAAQVELLADVATTGGAYDPPVALPAALSPFRKPSLTAAPAPALNGGALTTNLILALLYNDPAAAADPITEYGPNSHQASGIVWGSTVGFPTDQAIYLLSDQSASVYANGDGGSIPRAASLEPVAALSLVALVAFPAAPTAGGVLIGKLSTGGVNFAYALRIHPSDTSRVRFEIVDDIDGVVTVDSPVGTLTFPGDYAFVGTYDGAILRLYVNGLEVANQPNSGNIVHDATEDVGIGRDGSGGSPVNGNAHTEANFLWDRALTPDEAVSFFPSPFGVFTDSAIAYDFLASMDFAPGHPASAQLVELVADVPRGAGAAQVELVADVVPGVVNAAGLTFFSVSPAVGPDVGGQAVVIKGRNFVNISQVLFGGTPLTGLTVVDAGTITGTTPAHIPGTVSIRIDSTTAGFVEVSSAYTFVGGFGPAVTRLLIGMQFDPGLIRQEVFVGETAPLGVETTLALTLADIPIHGDAVEVYLRRLDPGHGVSDPGGVLMRQGAIYAYTVDLANRKIIWRATAPYELLPLDELTAVYVARGEI